MKLLTNILDRLERFKKRLFLHYQNFVESMSEEQLRDLHYHNKYLASIVPEFMSWYFNGDVERTERLIFLSRFSSGLLRRLRDEMVMSELTGTFEAFKMFKGSPEGQMKDLGAPDCTRRLLTASAKEQQLRLVNSLGVYLCVQNDKVVCCKEDELEDDEELCWVKVDRETALITISFKYGTGRWNLDASAPEGLVRMAVEGAPWKIKPIEDPPIEDDDDLEFYEEYRGNFKIFTDGGKNDTLDFFGISNRKICVFLHLT